MAIKAQHVNTAAKYAHQGALSAATGIVVAGVVKVFTKFNPMAGFILGASTDLISKITKPIFQKVFEQPGTNNEGKRLGYALHDITSIVGGYLVTNQYAAISLTQAVAFYYLSMAGIVFVTLALSFIASNSINYCLKHL